MTQELHFRITGMDCADCAAKLERGVGNLAGVEACRVNFATAKMEVMTTGTNPAAIVERIQVLGYGVAEPGQRYTPRTHRQQLIALLGQPRNTFTLIGAAFILAAFINQSFTYDQITIPVPVLSSILLSRAEGPLWAIFHPLSHRWVVWSLLPSQVGLGGAA